MGIGIGIGHVAATLTGPGGLRIAHEWDIAVRFAHPDLVLSQTAAQLPWEIYASDPALFAALIPGSPDAFLNGLRGSLRAAWCEHDTMTA